MKRWIIRGAGIAMLLGVAGFLVAASGIIPVKASSGHWAVTEWILRFSMQRSVATHSLAIKAPELDDPALVLQGAAHYEIGCRSCHGIPDTPRPRIAQAMLPQPPDLAPRIRASEPKKLFYVVKHGMKFTGMPAWPSQNRDDEVWAMVAFLMKLPELDGAGYRRLVHGEAGTRGSAGTLELGAERVPAATQSCMPCHGIDGRGRENSAFPKLAGQRVDYLENSLKAYAGGARHSGTMGPVASGLDRETIHQLARYYADVTAGTRPDPSARSSGTPAADANADPETIARGKAIALEGVRSQRVPACIECHGPGARRGKPAYPNLAGQPASYLENQLRLFKQEQRGGSEYAHLMRPVASRLTDAQMRDVTTYFASLNPAATSQPNEAR